MMSEFFGGEKYDELKLNVGNTQRIFMVAAKFRKEITSAVLWLLNYRLRVQCYKVTPYAVDGRRYVHFEQIIPVKDIEEYVIRMADKAQSDIAAHENEKSRHKIRREFWRQMITQANQRFELYRNVSPSKSS